MSTNIKELSIKSVIPLKAFYHLLDKNLISDPLTPEDLIKVKFLEQIWCDEKILKPQLSKMNKVNRERFIDSCEYSSKWERYVFTRLMNNNINTGKRITFKSLAQEIRHYYDVILTDKHKYKVSQIRQSVKKLKIHKIRQKEKRKKEEEEIKKLVAKSKRGTNFKKIKGQKA